jgi:hypothetical protein
MNRARSAKLQYNVPLFETISFSLYASDPMSNTRKGIRQLILKKLYKKIPVDNVLIVRIFIYSEDNIISNSVFKELFRLGFRQETKKVIKIKFASEKTVMRQNGTSYFSSCSLAP